VVKIAFSTLESRFDLGSSYLKRRGVFLALCIPLISGIEFAVNVAKNGDPAVAIVSKILSM